MRRHCSHKDYIIGYFFSKWVILAYVPIFYLATLYLHVINLLLKYYILYLLRYLETTTSKVVPIYTSKNKNCTAHTKIAFMKTHKTASRYLTLPIDFTFSFEIENCIYFVFFFLAQFKIYYSVMVLI